MVDRRVLSPLVLVVYFLDGVELRGLRDSLHGGGLTIINDCS